MPPWHPCEQVLPGGERGTGSSGSVEHRRIQTSVLRRTGRAVDTGDALDQADVSERSCLLSNALHTSSTTIFAIRRLIRLVRPWHRPAPVQF